MQDGIAPGVNKAKREPYGFPALFHSYYFLKLRSAKTALYLSMLTFWR